MTLPANWISCLLEQAGSTSPGVIWIDSSSKHCWNTQVQHLLVCTSGCTSSTRTEPCQTNCSSAQEQHALHHININCASEQVQHPLHLMHKQVLNAMLCARKYNYLDKHLINCYIYLLQSEASNHYRTTLYTGFPHHCNTFKTNFMSSAPLHNININLLSLYGKMLMSGDNNMTI